MQQNQSRRPARKQNIAHFLSLRPKSERQELNLLLKVYTLMRETAEDTYLSGVPRVPRRDMLMRLMLDAKKPKGIPTPEDQFALLLEAVFTASTPLVAQLALHNARSYLSHLVESHNRTINRHYGSQGGRGRRKSFIREPLNAIVSLKANELILSKPFYVTAIRSMFVFAVARQVEGFLKLSRAQQKNKMDAVRKILARNNWFKKREGKWVVNPEKLLPANA